MHWHLNLHDSIETSIVKALRWQHVLLRFQCICKRYPEDLMIFQEKYNRYSFGFKNNKMAHFIEAKLFFNGRNIRDSIEPRKISAFHFLTASIWFFEGLKFQLDIKAGIKPESIHRFIHQKDYYQTSFNYCVYTVLPKISKDELDTQIATEKHNLEKGKKLFSDK